MTYVARRILEQRRVFEGGPNLLYSFAAPLQNPGFSYLELGVDEEDFAVDIAQVTEKIHSATEAALASKENSNRRFQSQQ
jgi:hypothetical protein